MDHEAELLLQVAKSYAQASATQCDFVFRVSKDLVILNAFKMVVAPLMPPEQFLNKTV